ncbi:hypothetical protein [Shewanella psychrophila]|uniref:hypothetical protein n=1 Tax=Shewanella psychrophila TaxID=225848 RepID=UPI00098B2998|nr:hypothetical protein [Shewanella psychrophila]
MLVCRSKVLISLPLTTSPCQFNIQACELVEAKVLPIKVMTAILQLDAKVGIWMSQSLSSRYQTCMTMNHFLPPLIYNIVCDCSNAVSVQNPLLASPRSTKKPNASAVRSESTAE